MEINRFDDVLGVVPVEDITEGRFVLLTASTESYDFGSREDLAGAKLPDTAEEAKRAKFILTWAVTNTKPPFYQPTPAFDWAMRKGGWDQAANVPFANTTYLTYPGYQNCVVIPSGLPSLAFTEGTFTVYSGCYIDSAEIRVPGATFIVANAADDGANDAGKPKYTATMAVGVIGFVERYDSDNGALTLRIE